MESCAGEEYAPKVPLGSLASDCERDGHRTSCRWDYFPRHRISCLPPRDQHVRYMCIFPAVYESLTSIDRDCFYTTLVNAMDYTAGCFPVTTVDQELDQPVPPHEFYNHEDEALHAVCMLYNSCVVGFSSSNLSP